MADLVQQNFWKDFAKTSWEKKPRLLKKFASPLQDINETHIFSMLVEYSDHCRKMNKAQGFKLFLDGQMQYEEDVLQILPVKKDKSLSGYHLRMEKIFSDYCLVCDELLQASDENWGKLQQFTSNLFTHVGLPNRFVEIGLYLGNYKQTPFGVHVDGCGVFSFPVVGEKTFRLWSPAFGKQNPALDRAHEYSRYKKNSQLLKASAGDMTYWPSSAWHIAESDGSFNATWSLGVWVDKSHHTVCEEALQPLIEEKIKATGPAKTIKLPPLKNDGQVVQLPRDFLQSISALQNISANELHDCFMKAWLELSSKQGFKTPPLVKKQCKLTMKTKLTLKKPQRILWTHLKSERKIIYAFQGKLHESTPSTQFLKLVKALNLGATCLIAEFLNDSKKNHDLKILQLIANAGAFNF